MVFSQRTHNCRVVNDEARIGDLVFNKFTHKLVKKTSHSAGLRAQHFMLLAKVRKKFVCFVRIEVLWNLDVQSLFQPFDHTDAFEGGGEVNINQLAIDGILQMVGSMDAHYHARDHFFGDFEQVVVIFVGPVKLTGREFGIVSHINAFVAELTADFVDSVQASHNKLLQIELRRNAHVHVQIQVIVKSLERFGSGTTSDHVHHRRLHFEEAASVKKPSNVIDNFAPNVEIVPHVLVEHQIEVTLAVACFFVSEPVVLRWEHVQTGS
mmetsp:Transcript_15884/g.31125  ORF Transcript_15884/g.31125 Transcript_15884/m.31125 type:complete len:266 (+) Transcript_15884:2233-3030(+)